MKSRLLVIAGGCLLLLCIVGCESADEKAFARFQKFVDMLEGESGLETVQEIDRLISTTDEETGTPCSISCKMWGIGRGPRSMEVMFLTVETDRDIDLSGTELPTLSDDEVFLYSAIYWLEHDSWVLRHYGRKETRSEVNSDGEIIYHWTGRGFEDNNLEIGRLLRRSLEF